MLNHLRFHTWLQVKKVVYGGRVFICQEKTPLRIWCYTLIRTLIWHRNLYLLMLERQAKLGASAGCESLSGKGWPTTRIECCACGGAERFCEQNSWSVHRESCRLQGRQRSLKCWHRSEMNIFRFLAPYVVVDHVVANFQLSQHCV